MDKVRVDKWLWAVRIFKSRTLATESCKSGKIRVNGVNAKASQSIARGDLLEVKKNGYHLQFKVVDLLGKRVSATLAAPCYENLTTEEEMNKYKDWFIGKGSAERREKGSGRPTKKDRRVIDDFKDWDL